MSEYIDEDRVEAEENRRLDAFSPQTRQTKTALMLITASLFVFSTIGEPILKNGERDGVQIVPWPYTVPESAFYVFLLIGAVYFWISFTLSATYEIRRFSYVDRLRGASDHFKACLVALDSFQRGTQKVIREKNSVLYEVQTRIENIDLNIFNDLQQKIASEYSEWRPTIQFVRELLDHLNNSFLQFRRPVDRSQIEAEEANMPEFFAKMVLEMRQVVGHYESENRKWIEMLEREEGRLKGLSRFKHNFWEYDWPIGITAALIITSLPAHFLDWRLTHLF